MMIMVLPIYLKVDITCCSVEVLWSLVEWSSLFPKGSLGSLILNGETVVGGGDGVVDLDSVNREYL